MRLHEQETRFMSRSILTIDSALSSSILSRITVQKTATRSKTL